MSDKSRVVVVEDEHRTQVEACRHGGDACCDGQPGRWRRRGMRWGAVLYHVPCVRRSGVLRPYGGAGARSFWRKGVAANLKVKPRLLAHDIDRRTTPTYSAHTRQESGPSQARGDQ